MFFVACSRRSDSGARAKNIDMASERAGKKTRGDWRKGRRDLFPETRFEDNLFIPYVKHPAFGKSLSACCNTYSTVRDSMEYDLRMGTPYPISCLRQQPSGVDRRRQIWPIRGYTRFWYTTMSFLKLISQAFPHPLPQSPLVYSRTFARYIFRSRSTI